MLLKEQNVGNLKRELEEHDVYSNGKKFELQEKLRQNLIEGGNDPDATCTCLKFLGL